MRSASMLIPKKVKTYCPIKNETIKIIKTLIAVHNDILERSISESS
jgi:hypothetical protein